MMKYDIKTLEFESFKDFLLNNFISSFSTSSFKSIKILHNVDDIYKRQNEIKQAVEFSKDVLELVEDDKEFFNLFYTLNDSTKSFDPVDFIVIKKDEIKGITDALSHAGIKNVDLVTIRMEDSIKCIDQYLQYGHPINAHFPVMRGICFAVSQYECLLWTHGTIDSVKPNRSYFPGGRGILSPLRIIKYHGNGSMLTIAREILGFTKMNWNSFNFYTKFPATIDTSNTLAQVGNLLGHYDGRTYDYRYFI